MNTTAFVSSKKSNIVAKILAMVFWFLHRYNKTNKFFNVWERSEKDKSAFGVNNKVRFYVSRDGRLQVRWNIFSVYVLKPWTIERTGGK